MKVRNLLVLPWFLAALLLLAGCGNRDGSDNGTRLHAENKRNQQERDAFESRKKDPDISADTNYAAGLFAEEKGQLAEAAAMYRTALKREPKHLSSMYRLGVVYSKMKDFPKSIEVWKRYIKVTNESADAFSNLAYTHELAGQLPEAELAYQKGIARDGDNVACRVNYGLMLARQDKMNEAMLQFQTVLTPPEVHYNLASAYEARGHNDQARAEYRKALELDPTFNDAKSRLAALN